MPIYLVRWRNLSAALVRARNEAELVVILDEVDDPSGCTWTVYNGPLFVDFELPATLNITRPEEDERVEPLRPDEVEVVIDDPEGLYSLNLRPLKVDADTAFDMNREIVRRCFPSLFAATERAEEPLGADALREALMADLAPLFAHHWRAANAEREIKTKTPRKPPLM